MHSRIFRDEEKTKHSFLKLGLVASSTPFVTGRPVTLFKNRDIYSSGAVGIALTGLAPKVRSVFPGLRAITERLTVTRYVCSNKMAKMSNKIGS